MKETLLQKFSEIFGDNYGAKVYFAPGRVNLIGEHTDYNGGHVFPCALTIGTYAAARKRNDKLLRFYSMNFDDLGIIEVDMNNITNKKEDDWANYPKGIIVSLCQRGYNVTNGMDILYLGNIPNGSGLSSSASIEILTGFILKDMYKFGYDMIENALIGQYSENIFNDVRCGIMDQFSIAMGKKEHAIFLNTSNLYYEYAKLSLHDAKIIIMNTCKKRGLGDSKYNKRRAECEAALAEIRTEIDVKHLCDLSVMQFEKYKHTIKDDTLRRRAKHVVYENARTLRAVEVLKENRLEEFGKLMIASHNSLRDDYEVTGIELDTLVKEALKQPGIIGARMTGAGFGGCAVSIVQTEYIEAFKKNVGMAYKEQIGYPCEFYVVEIGDGPQIL